MITCTFSDLESLETAIQMLEIDLELADSMIEIEAVKKDVNDLKKNVDSILDQSNFKGEISC